MPAYVIPAPAQATIAVHGEASVFPVRRIWCIGRNYSEHAREMGHDPEREPPFFFAKPADAVVAAGTLPFPIGTQDLHHEVELAVLIGKGGSDIAPGEALAHIYGYAVALDMTKRDLQAEAKRLSRPWELSKSFDQSCPISDAQPARIIGHPTSARIALSVNGELRQQADINQMIWNVPDAIAYLSQFVALAPGDVILMGTPAGVGQVKPGDELTGTCEGIGKITIRYAA